LLASCIESFRRYVRVQHDDRLGAQQPVLGATERQHVDPGTRGDLAERDAEGGGGVPDPGAVHVQRHSETVHVVGDRPYFADGVDRPELRGLREADDEGLGAVLVAPAPGLPVDEGRGELAVRRRNGQQLEPAHPLRCAGLVGVDVSRLTRHDRAPTRHHRRQADDVAAGAVEDGKDLCLCSELGAYHLGQPGRVRIRSVGHLMAAVGRGDRRQDFGVHPRVVVARERTGGRIVEAHPASLPHRARAEVRVPRVEP
jgi:hypothetical protein